MKLLLRGISKTWFRSIWIQITPMTTQKPPSAPDSVSPACCQPPLEHLTLPLELPNPPLLFSLPSNHTCSSRTNTFISTSSKNSHVCSRSSSRIFVSPFRFYFSTIILLFALFHLLHLHNHLTTSTQVSTEAYCRQPLQDLRLHGGLHSRWSRVPSVCMKTSSLGMHEKLKNVPQT